MDGKFVIITLLLGLVVLNISMIVGSLRHKEQFGGRIFALMMGSLVIYSLGYLWEISTVELGIKLFAIYVQYLGIFIFPLSWLMLALHYSGYRTWLNWTNLWVISFIPILTFLLIITNSFHHLYYSSIWVDSSGIFPNFAFTKGVWYYIHIFYFNVLIIFGNIFYLRKFVSSTPKHLFSAILVFFATLLLWLGYFLFETPLNPWGIDLNLFSFNLMGILLALGMFRSQTFSLVPIARSLVFEKFSHPVLVLDKELRILDLNTNAKNLLFPDTPDVLGKNLMDMESMPVALLSLLENPGLDQVDFPIITETSRMYYQGRKTPLTDPKGTILGTILSLTDETERTLLLLQLQELETKDSLTGINNRRHFLEQAEAELSRARRKSTPLAVILFDLDDFKKINDSWGHQVGDLALKNAAEIAMGNLRSHDILGRYGGEEFTILLPETNFETAMAIAERLRAGIEACSLILRREPLRFTASFGVKGVPQVTHDHSLSDLINAADASMYMAKQKGKNLVVGS